MKRVLSLFTIIAVMCTVCSSIASAESATIELGTAQTKAGETVTVPLTIKGNSGFSSLGIEIVYDKDIFTLVSAVNDENVGGIYTASQEITENPYNLVWNNVSNITYNGTLAELKFKVSETAKAGDYPITVSYSKGRDGNYEDGEDINFDEDFNSLNLTYVNGSILVETETPVVTEIPTETEAPVETEEPNGVTITKTSANIVTVRGMDNLPNSEGVLIAAQYDDNGVLKKVVVYDLKYSTNYSANLRKDFNYDDELVLMIWDSIEAMTPYAKENVKVVRGGTA